jgi:hypothetical protein
MSKNIVFIQVQGRDGVLEAEVAEPATLGALHDALGGAGVTVDADCAIFIDEADEELRGERHEPLHGVKHGARVHVCRCRRIKTTVHYLDKTAEHSFSPGKRVRAVKAWAVAHFKLDHKDAAEHVLQICNSPERPPSDTPLHRLVHGHHCEVCFDLVPEKRVEG